MKRWMLYTKKAEFEKAARQYGISPIIARIIRNRDVVSEEEIAQFLTGSVEELPSPWTMKGVRQAVDIIHEKVSEKKKIRIIGDYDVDGVCAVAILLSGLRKIGATVDCAIPDRITDGYGINESLVLKAFESGVDTIVTCDNGIAANRQIEYAKGLGMTVIVTDHHEIPFVIEEDGSRKANIPCADVVMNPKQEDCGYGFEGICGAVVALKLIQALYEAQGYKPDTWQEEFLELATIATVGDVMKLRGENRILVKAGLARLRTTENIGLKALIDVNSIHRQALSTYHIGFVLGPCLNASGRLDSATKSLELLMARNKEQADVAAADLKSFNESRKMMTEQGTKKAIQIIETEGFEQDKILVVFLLECHESIAGIIAGRIRERYYRPVLIFTPSEEGVKASGRSIEGYDMFQELSSCKELFKKFGGHAMAAGLSMEEANIEILRRRLNEQTTLTAADLEEKIHIDVPMPIDYVTEQFIDELKVLEPFGNGNPRPVFAERHIRILSMEKKGRERQILKLRISNQSTQIDAVYFGDIEKFENYISEQFGELALRAVYHRLPNPIDIGILFYPSVNEYLGNRTLQIVIEDYCRLDN